MNVDWTVIFGHVAANWPDESSNSEWLATHWSEALSEDERAMFCGFGDFAASVREARNDNAKNTA